MTLAASHSTMQQDSTGLSFNFESAELTSQIRQASKKSLTGYWSIQFEETPEHEAVQWFISLLDGKVIHCGSNAPTCKDFLDIMQRYSGLRKGVMGQQIKALRSNPIDKHGPQVKQMVKQLVIASLVTMEEIENSFKTYILNEFDRYLVHSGSGKAEFKPTPEFTEFAPYSGLDFNALLLESVRRRVKWTSFKPLIPSLESRLTLPSKSVNGVSLQEAQWQTLKGLIQDGKTLTEISQAMGRDGLTVAKSFLNLIQQKLIVIESGEDSPTETPQARDKTPEVFIVDDSPLLIRQFRNLLEHWGYNVHSSEDSVGVMDKLLEVKPDIIFLDINMPEVTGFDLIKLIRRQTALSNVPLVMLTAEKSVSNQWRAQWASCKFLAKPRSADDVSEFRVSLKQLLRELAPLASDVLV